MNGLERLNQQIGDLTGRYTGNLCDDRPLMEQLEYLGPHLRPSFGVARKIQPSSRPPGNLTAHQLHRRIMLEAADWAWTLGGHTIRQDRCLPTIPVLAEQRIASGQPEKTRILHGPTGLYATVGGWHLKARIFLGYDRPADRYPHAICPHCQMKGSIRGHGSRGWCANPDCRDETGRRRDIDVERLLACGIDLTVTYSRSP